VLSVDIEGVRKTNPQTLAILLAIYCGVCPPLKALRRSPSPSPQPLPRVLIIGGLKSDIGRYISLVLSEISSEFSSITHLGLQSNFDPDDYWSSPYPDTIIFDLVTSGLEVAEISELSPSSSKITSTINVVGGRGAALSQYGFLGATAAIKSLEGGISEKEGKEEADVTISNGFVDFMERLSTELTGRQLTVLDGNNGLEGFWERVRWPRSSSGQVWGYMIREGFNEDDDEDEDDEEEEVEEEERDVSASLFSSFNILLASCFYFIFFFCLADNL